MGSKRVSDQNDLDQAVARFYARNPGATPVVPVEEVGPNEDRGTLSLQDVLADLSVQRIGDVSFQNEVMPVVRKRLAWNTVPDDLVAKYSKGLRISPGSEEGDAVERNEAGRRMVLLLPLMPLVGVMANTTGDLISRAKALASEAGTEDEGSLRIDPSLDVTAEVAAGTMAVIANLLDLGVLKYGNGVSAGV